MYPGLDYTNFFDNLYPDICKPGQCYIAYPYNCNNGPCTVYDCPYSVEDPNCFWDWNPANCDDYTTVFSFSTSTTNDF